jgi:hypothetical protein
MLWKALGPLFGAVTGTLLRWPALPREGALIHSASAAWFCVEGDDPLLAKQLLSGLLDAAFRRGYGALNLCLGQGHPLLKPLAASFGGFKTWSHLALLHWPEGFSALVGLDSRPAFIDITELA